MDNKFSLEERIAEMANADAALPLGDSQVMGDKKDTYFAYKSDSNGRERAAKGAEQMGLSQEAPMTEIYESVIERAIEEYKPIVKQRLKDLGVGPGQELIVLAMRCHPMS